jgi:serine/threonine-protein kinase RsbW
MRHGAVTLRIDSQLRDVFLVGLSVRAIGAAALGGADGAHALELCVVEAVNNAIEHAYGSQPGHPVEVRVALSAGELRVEVRDRGRSMDWPAAIAEMDAAARDPLAEGGRGLLIMHSLMDRVAYARGQDGWNVLTLGKSVREAEGPPLRRSGAS